MCVHVCVCVCVCLCVYVCMRVCVCVCLYTPRYIMECRSICTHLEGSWGMPLRENLSFRLYKVVFEAILDHSR